MSDDGAFANSPQLELGTYINNSSAQENSGVCSLSLSLIHFHSEKRVDNITDYNNNNQYSLKKQSARRC